MLACHWQIESMRFIREIIIQYYDILVRMKVRVLDEFKIITNLKNYSGQLAEIEHYCLSGEDDDLADLVAVGNLP